jgi:hypothetical protein
LNSANSGIRNCIEKNRIFRNLKCRPKLDQKTRWSSALLMLLSVKKAYENGAFDGDITCPIPYETIEVYIQILFTSLAF